MLLKEVRKLLPQCDVCLDFASLDKALEAKKKLKMLKFCEPVHVTGPDMGDQVRWNRYVIATFPVGPLVHPPDELPTDAVKVPFAPPTDDMEQPDPLLPKGVKLSRAEERRTGKGRRSRRSPKHSKKN